MPGRISMRLRGAAALVLVLVLAGGAASAQVELQTFSTASLTISTAKGLQRFEVELALTPAQQEQGLMFRQSLPADDGMLFLFPDVETAHFWMRNTFIPLDMLFIAANGRIADIHERAIPFSEDVIQSSMPVRAVLEVNGGTVTRLGIKPGDLVHYPAFGTAK